MAKAYQASPAVVLAGCSPEAFESLQPRVDRSDLLRLARVTCASFSPSSFGTSEGLVSPDGKKVVRWHRGSPAPVEVADLRTASNVLHYPNRVTFRSFGPAIGGFGAVPDTLAWSTDSSSLWTVRQDTVSPSGFAKSGLRPMRLGLDGKLRLAPVLMHAAGPLDAIHWVGSEGLAIAQFGTRGGYYKPEHDDPSPTLALVDVADSRIRQSVPVSLVPGLAERVQNHGFMAQGVSGALLRDGRLRVVMRFGAWAERSSENRDQPGRPAVRRPPLQVIWTEGEAPRAWRVEDDEVDKSIVLSSDGSKLLVVRQLQARGVRVSCFLNCPPAPPPEPVTGTIAELVDVPSGRLLWRMPARAKEFWNQRGKSAISNDGKYALVEIPPEEDRSMIALIAMRDGAVLQRFSAVRVGSYPQDFGFSADQGSVWLTCDNVTFEYRIKA